MKVLTKEEEAAHYNATVFGGLKGGAYGLGIGLASAFILQRRSQFFRSLTLPLKAFFVSSTTTFALIIAADNASRNFERNRHGFADYRDETAKMVARSRENMTTGQKAMQWGRENRYKIVGGSWVASMAGSLALVYRDPFLSKSQKLVQARVYAQGLTLLVLIASAAFEISDSRNQVEGAPKVHHEHYKGEDLWKDMVRQEEEKIARRKEEIKHDLEEKGEQVKRTYDEGKETAKQTYEDSKKKAKQTYREGKETARQTYDDGRETAKQAYDDGKEQAQQTYQDGKEQAQQTYEDGKDKANDMYEAGKEKAKRAVGR